MPLANSIKYPIIKGERYLALKKLFSREATISNKNGRNIYKQVSRKPFLSLYGGNNPIISNIKKKKKI
jgi:hypothetical protein